MKFRNNSILLNTKQRECFSPCTVISALLWREWQLCKMASEWELHKYFSPMVELSIVLTATSSQWLKLHLPHWAEKGLRTVWFKTWPWSDVQKQQKWGVKQMRNVSSSSFLWRWVSLIMLGNFDQYQLAFLFVDEVPNVNLQNLYEQHFKWVGKWTLCPKDLKSQLSSGSWTVHPDLLKMIDLLLWSELMRTIGHNLGKNGCSKCCWFKRA